MRQDPIDSSGFLHHRLVSSSRLFVFPTKKDTIFRMNHNLLDYILRIDQSIRAIQGQGLNYQEQETQLLSGRALLNRVNPNDLSNEEGRTALRAAKHYTKNRLKFVRRHIQKCQRLEQSQPNTAILEHTSGEIAMNNTGENNNNEQVRII